MRVGIPRALALASCLSVAAGCSVMRHSTSDAERWGWTQNASTEASTPYQPYAVGRGTPAHIGAWTPGSRPPEFDFSHPRVDDYVARFQTDLRGFFADALSRSGRYVPRMSSILEKEGLPQELAYLPLIESGFRTQAVSRAGAVGPWQFIRTTGQRYGLRIDQYVDERRDPVKSTHAAARYLKDLYDMFGNWHLSLAAYNTGEGHITRILGRGVADDFWQMSDRGYLYQETENYVPQFLAALHIAEEPRAYGFDPPGEAPVHYDLVTVNKPLSLATVAQLSGTSTDTIKDLNPALHRGIVPPQGYAVRLPKGTKEAFEVALANLPPSYFEPAMQVRTRGRRGRGVGRGHRVRRGRASGARHHVVATANTARGGRSGATVVALRHRHSRTVY
jgi:hypothetical protein